ncbi:hypothetical protein RFI_01341 [Reticulomyxa filosa]|uniref:Uncharacterized protein n=1 Tax=Reticulomyxa filosa TaxID=46433 RepID=X6PC15_RETFI|nr:hypothetical protein RFI_01341 [Reticulomyxa filosa]|eukprot:ETO35721.1 hypothetical protein RFI_01341 [Reticulomyxa filosa]
MLNQNEAEEDRMKRLELPDMTSESTLENPLIVATLPPLPTELWLGQCVSVEDEILICGGYFMSKCYSYHVTKRQYKEVCAYPIEVELDGHSVIKCEEQTAKRYTTLVSLGGDGEWTATHMLVLRYQSVWKSVGTCAREGERFNEWIIVESKQSNDKNKDWTDARGLVSGENNNLLFVTHPPHNIDIIDLRSFSFVQHVQDSHLPVSELHFHGLVLLAPNHFLLLHDGNMYTFRYDQSANRFTFDEQKTESFHSVLMQQRYTYVFLEPQLIVLGGYSGSWRTSSDDVHVFHVHCKTWTRYPHKIPLSINGSVAVARVGEPVFHLIGGQDTKGQHLNTHFIFKCQHVGVFLCFVLFVSVLVIYCFFGFCLFVWYNKKKKCTPKEVNVILRHWIRCYHLKSLGWAVDFAALVLHFLMKKGKKKMKVILFITASTFLSLFLISHYKFSFAGKYAFFVGIYLLKFNLQYSKKLIPFTIISTTIEELYSFRENNSIVLNLKIMATKEDVSLKEWFLSLDEAQRHELIRIAVNEGEVFAATVEKMLQPKKGDKSQIRLLHAFVRSMEMLWTTPKNCLQAKHQFNFKKDMGLFFLFFVVPLFGKIAKTMKQDEPITPDMCCCPLASGRKSKTFSHTIIFNFVIFDCFFPPMKMNQSILALPLQMRELIDFSQKKKKKTN